MLCTVTYLVIAVLRRQSILGKRRYQSPVEAVLRLRPRSASPDDALVWGGRSCGHQDVAIGHRWVWRRCRLLLRLTSPLALFAMRLEVSHKERMGVHESRERGMDIRLLVRERAWIGCVCDGSMWLLEAWLQGLACDGEHEGQGALFVQRREPI